LIDLLQEGCMSTAAMMGRNRNDMSRRIPDAEREPTRSPMRRLPLR